MISDVCITIWHWYLVLVSDICIDIWYMNWYLVFVLVSGIWLVLVSVVCVMHISIVNRLLVQNCPLFMFYFSPVTPIDVLRFRGISQFLEFIHPSAGGISLLSM